MSSPVTHSVLLRNHSGKMVYKCVLVLLLSVLVCCDQSLDGYWMSWKTEHNKKYNNSMEEWHRRAVWEQNVKEVMQHNAEKHHSYSTSINQLSDMTAEEVNKQLNGLKVDFNDFPQHDVNESFSFLTELPLPPQVDWTQKGFVSPVQNQGPCGSCWAFSAVGALEGQMKKRSGSLVPLSPQNLLDCSSSLGNRGCLGGYLTKSFLYIIRNKGIDSDQLYPYEHKVGSCRYTLKGRAGFCSGYKILPRNNEQLLQYAVANVGPISVGINGKTVSLHRYSSGIYNDPACDNRMVNHAVLVVGYGTEGNQPYWLVKNSWGTVWGEKGFIRIARNRNQCGIANFAVYPTL